MHVTYEETPSYRKDTETHARFYAGICERVFNFVCLCVAVLFVFFFQLVCFCLFAFMCACICFFNLRACVCVCMFACANVCVFAFATLLSSLLHLTVVLLKFWTHPRSATLKEVTLIFPYFETDTTAFPLSLRGWESWQCCLSVLACLYVYLYIYWNTCRPIYVIFSISNIGILLLERHVTPLFVSEFT